MQACIEKDQRRYRVVRAQPAVGHQQVVQLSQRAPACILSSVSRRGKYDRCKGRRCLGDDVCVHVVCVRVCVRVCVFVV